MIVVVVGAAIGAFARSMTLTNHNEEMYIPASALVAEGELLYRDFAFLQTPYVPYLFAGVFRVFDVETSYLLAGRLVNYALLILSAFLLEAIARRVGLGLRERLMVLAYLLLNRNIVESASEASNYILPVAASFGSFLLWTDSVKGRRLRSVRMSLSGLLLAIAIGAKLTYASLVAPFLLACLVYPREQPFKLRVLSSMPAFTVGLGVGLAPVLWFYWGDPLAFRFNNLGIHMLTGVWQGIENPWSLSNVWQRVVFAFEVLIEEQNLLLVLAVLTLIAPSSLRYPRTREDFERLAPGVLLSVTLLLTGLATALAPPRPFEQYYAMPMSLLLIVLVYALAFGGRRAAKIPQRIFGVLLAVTLAFSGPWYLRKAERLLTREEWVPVRVSDTAMRIRKALDERGIGADEPVATLTPNYVISSGTPVYRELAAGPFVFRVGDELSAEDRERFVTTSPKTLAELLDAEPPGAVLTGFEGELDEPLIDYAETRGYERVDGDFGKGELRVRSRSR